MAAGPRAGLLQVSTIDRLGIGLAAGTAVYFAGPWLAAAFGGVGGVATTLAVQAGLWLRRTFGVSALSDA